MTLLVLVAVLVTLLVLETILTEVEHFGWATVILLASVAAAQFFGLVNILAFVKDNTVASLGYVGLYVVGGVAWSFVKWFSYLRNYRDQFRDYKTKFLTGQGLPLTTSIVEPTLLKTFKDWLGSDYHWRRGDVNLLGLQNLERPRARNNKGRIVAWCSYWPLSAIGTVLNDPVRRFFTWLFNAFSSLYQRMSDYVFRNDVELK